MFMKALRTGMWLLCAGLWLGLPLVATAHCDTLNGPVVKDARKALQKGDVTPVLKWVKAEHEAEVRAAFGGTLRVRVQSAEARELAEMYFFETMVRLHRAGEGAPYTGLKPADTPLDPPIAAVEKALENGSERALLEEMNEIVAAGIRKRFMRALQARAHAEDSVEAGREFVAAYVELMHYVERLHLDASGASAEAASPKHTH